ncbi:MAG: hypothetical protein PUB87_03935 [Eubacteriaceae bacterium]|nr:hypothetical protein [Eubacteriaceae bacterium]
MSWWFVILFYAVVAAVGVFDVISEKKSSRHPMKKKDTAAGSVL